MYFLGHVSDAAPEVSVVKSGTYRAPVILTTLLIMRYQRKFLEVIGEVFSTLPYCFVRVRLRLGSLYKGRIHEVWRHHLSRIELRS